MDMILSCCACVVCLIGSALFETGKNPPDISIPRTNPELEDVEFLSDDELILACQTYAEMQGGEQTVINGEMGESRVRKNQTQSVVEPPVCQPRIGAIVSDHMDLVNKNFNLIRQCNHVDVQVPYYADENFVLNTNVNGYSGLSVYNRKSYQREDIDFYKVENRQDFFEEWLLIQNAYLKRILPAIGVPSTELYYSHYRCIASPADELTVFASILEYATNHNIEVTYDNNPLSQEDEFLLAFAYRDYFFVRHVRANKAVLHKNEMQIYNKYLIEMLKGFVDIQHGKKNPVDAKPIYQEAVKSWCKLQIRDTNTEIRKFVTAVPQGQYAHDLYPDNSGSKRKKELGLKDGPIHNTIPNVNEGKCTDGAVQSFIKQHPGYSRTYSEGGKVSYAATVQSTGNRIDYQIAHHVNPDQAMNMLFHFINQFPNQWSPIPESSKRYVRYTPGSGPLKSLGRVGDFDMPLKDYLTPDGMLIEGSDKSAVFFIRGNTAVGIQSVDPTVDVLPWAKEIDEKLKKNLATKGK